MNDDDDAFRCVYSCSYSCSYPIRRNLVYVVLILFTGVILYLDIVSCSSGTLTTIAFGAYHIHSFATMAMHPTNRRLLHQVVLRHLDERPPDSMEEQLLTAQQQQQPTMMEEQLPTEVEEHSMEGCN